MRAMDCCCSDPPVNDHTSSNDCFYLSVARVFLRTTNERALRKFVEDYVVKLYNGADIPVHVTDITKFLNMNPNLKLRINVLNKQRNLAKKNREEYDIYPVYTPKNIKSPHSLNLLLHKKVVNDEIRHHYSYIPSLSKFLDENTDQISPSKKVMKTLISVRIVSISSHIWFYLKDMKKSAFEKNRELLNLAMNPSNFLNMKLNTSFHL